MKLNWTGNIQADSRKSRWTSSFRYNNVADQEQIILQKANLGINGLDFGCVGGPSANSGPVRSLNKHSHVYTCDICCTFFVNFCSSSPLTPQPFWRPASDSPRSTSSTVTVRAGAPTSARRCWTRRWRTAWLWQTRRSSSRWRSPPSAAEGKLGFVYSFARSLAAPLRGALLSSQEWLPQANGGPADPQGHLQLLRGHHVVHHQNGLLRAVRQREHRHLRAGNGQAGDELRTPSASFPNTSFCFGFSFKATWKW